MGVFQEVLIKAAHVPPFPTLHHQHPLCVFSPHSCERPATTPFKGVDKMYDLSPCSPPSSPPLIEVRLLNRSTKQRHPVAYHGSLTDGPGGGGALFCGDLEELRGQAYRHLLFHQRLPSRWWHEQPKCVRGEDATVVKGLTKLIIKKWCLLLEQNHGVL